MLRPRWDVLGAHTSAVGIALAAIVVAAPPLAAAPLSPPALSAYAGDNPAAGSSPSLVHRVAIFGRDNRRPVPPKYRYLKQQIGVLVNRTAPTTCTAFCVADNIIATAAHCLFRRRGGKFVKIGDFRFEVGHDSHVISSPIRGALDRSAGQNVIAGTTRLRLRPPIDAASDWALARLERPVCRGQALAVKRVTKRELARNATAGRVFQIAFHSDYKSATLAYSTPCKVREEFPELRSRAIRRDFRNSKSLILHHCDTGGASSGSPLLMNTPGGPVVVGINVGTYIQSKVLTRNGRVEREFKARPIANTGVNASVFADLIPTLQNADIIGDPQGIAALQRGLGERGHYGGTIDGVFGNLTRAAIQTYEQHGGHRRIGLPTRALLRELAVAPPPPVRNATRAISGQVGRTTISSAQGDQ